MKKFYLGFYLPVDCVIQTPDSYDAADVREFLSENKTFRIDLVKRILKELPKTYQPMIEEALENYYTTTKVDIQEINQKLLTIEIKDDKQPEKD